MRWIWIFFILFVGIFAVHGETSSGDPALLLKDLRIPEEIHGGDEFNVSFNVVNQWFYDITEISVYMEGNDLFLNKSPSEPIFVEKLFAQGGKTSRPLLFFLKADDSLDEGTYFVNVVLTYNRYSAAAALAGRGAIDRYRAIIPIQIKVMGSPHLDFFVKGSDPLKIRPGDTADISFKVINTGDDEAKNILLYPHSIEEIHVLWSSRAVYVGDIPPGGASSSSIQLEAGDKIPENEYTLPMVLRYENNKGKEFSENRSFLIEIEGMADFEIKNMGETLKSGEKNRPVNFTVRNSGSRKAEELKAILKASYPFTPTGNEYYIGDLAPGEETQVYFHVDTDSAASTQRYPIDVVLKWEEDDDRFTDTISSFIEIVWEPPKSYKNEIIIFVVFIFLVMVLRKIVKK